MIRKWEEGKRKGNEEGKEEGWEERKEREYPGRKEGRKKLEKFKKISSSPFLSFSGKKKKKEFHDDAP